MRILLDEHVPEALLEVLRHLLREDDISTVKLLGWMSKDDVLLYRDAASRFDAVLTNDKAQLDSVEITKAIRKSRIHHIRYGHRQQNAKGLALAMGAVTAAMPSVVDELSHAPAQRLVRIEGLNPDQKRYEVIDPRRNPPRYWRG